MFLASSFAKFFYISPSNPPPPPNQKKRSAKFAIIYIFSAIYFCMRHLYHRALCKNEGHCTEKSLNVKIKSNVGYYRGVYQYYYYSEVIFFAFQSSE